MEMLGEYKFIGTITKNQAPIYTMKERRGNVAGSVYKDWEDGVWKGLVSTFFIFQRRCYYIQDN